MSSIFNQPFGLTWRKALLSAPRLVPDAALYLINPDGPHPIVIKIPSRGTHLIPLYVFIPGASKLDTSTSIEPTRHPVLLDFHGGGFIFGSCQEQAPWCAKIARELNAVSISVDYRLGPAAKFPAANEDSEDVLNAVLDPTKPGYQELRYLINEYLLRTSKRRIELDVTKFAASGFSSGGNLALNLGLNVRSSRVEEGDLPCLFPPSYARDIPLLLFFPSLDCRQLPSERPRPPIMEQQKASFSISLELESTLMPTYLPRDQAGHPRASPGLAKIRDGGLHDRVKMLLILPEMDTLAEQSHIWVSKVAEEGRASDLTVEEVKGVVHGWTQFPDSWLTEEHQKLKLDMFNKARDFIAQAWK
ncbi:alpha/beta hydrolase fold-domain-containing protein [Calycina marina]|uniref:Alpha/beta hydrolase fold-domain-containing protein n=1 Tax=Calycina marina TaxID=1763456 RepID=A0A9P7Z106_9HELO|nr:alpha/beta hydrolase fold-domain-containing protein [Calycina marina]